MSAVCLFSSLLLAWLSAVSLWSPIQALKLALLKLRAAPRMLPHVSHLLPDRAILREGCFCSLIYFPFINRSKLDKVYPGVLGVPSQGVETTVAERLCVRERFQ